MVQLVAPAWLRLGIDRPLDELSTVASDPILLEFADAQDHVEALLAKRFHEKIGCVPIFRINRG